MALLSRAVWPLWAGSRPDVPGTLVRGRNGPAHLRLRSASSHWPWPKGPLSSICWERPVLQTVASVGAWCPRISLPWVLEE